MLRQIEEARDRLTQIRDPESNFFPKEKIQVFRPDSNIETIQKELNAKRETESMRLLNEMTQLAKAEESDKE